MRVVWTGYGAAAYEALRGVVGEVKGGDPLAPVSVLVPTNLCGVIARRVLARGVGGRPGIAGLSVLTVDRLAELIAAAALTGAGRRPATSPVVAAAWRRALAEGPGVFAAVMGHPATVRALVAAHRELREVAEGELDAIGGCGEPIAADLVRLHRRVAGLLGAEWYDTSDLRRAATAVLRGEPRRGREIGEVVLFLPQELSPSATALLRELPAAGLRVVAGRTGEERADAGVISAVRGLAAGDGDVPVVVPVTATRVVTASDPDDEVRCVVRLLVARLAEVPAHRVAVLYGAAEPYARLLAEHLGAAGITANGTAVRPVIERAFPRALLGLLALPDHGWRRDEVLALLAGAPVLGADGRLVPVSRWERISRAAGVVGGGDWEARLAGYAAAQRSAAERERGSEAPREERVAALERDAEVADALRGFVAGLRGRVEAGAGLSSWAGLAGWTTGTFRALFGDVADEPRLPEGEARAAETVARVVAGLTELGAVEPVADLTALGLTLGLELADDLPRQGRFGTGVLVAPLGSAIGLDLDVVFVVGLAEELVPGRLREDALLPERVRALAPQLAPLRDRLDRQHRQLLAALAAAPERIVSFPRGDLRRSSTRLPSRWLLPSLRALSGQPGLQATGWESVSGRWLDGSPSYAAGLTSGSVLPSEQEWRIRAVLAGHGAGMTVDEVLATDVVAGRAMAMIRGWACDGLTRYDGDVSGHGIPGPADAGQVVSPTALEEWARCPHAYFVRRLLRVEPPGTPEELVNISPLEAGSLIHEVLDRFFTGQSLAGAVPGGGQRWSAAQRGELERVVLEVAGEFESRGVTGHPLLWRQERNRIAADLQLLLGDDELLRAQTGRVQVGSELSFGIRERPAVRVGLPDGREIWFRGSADRVDRAGSALVVVDYNTGSAGSFKTISAANPTADGTKLQLPVYAHAARAGLGTPETGVSAEYWFLRKDRGKRVALTLTPEVNEAYGAALAVIADGIAGGLFPHRPPDGDGWAGYVECSYCDTDGLGVKEVRDRWERKRRDPRLGRYLALVDPAASDMP